MRSYASPDQNTFFQPKGKGNEQGSVLLPLSVDSELFLYYHEYVGTTVILFYKPLAHITKHCVSHLIHRRLQQCQKCHINILALKKKSVKKLLQTSLVT